MEAAENCDRALCRFPGDDPDHRRARDILTSLSGHCRTAAAAFDADPTLLDEPDRTGRFRAADILAGLAHQMCGLLRSACSDTGLDRWPRQTRWEEVEALFARAAHLAEVIPQVIPRRDHATEAGSRAISRDRLAAYADCLVDVVDIIDASIGPALRLPHPDPAAFALADLAEDLARHAANLDAHHTQRFDALAAACGLPGTPRPEPYVTVRVSEVTVTPLRTPR